MLGDFILINTNSLGDLIYPHDFKYHLYTDKFQIYISSSDLSIEIQTKYPTAYSISPLGYLKLTLNLSPAKLTLHSYCSFPCPICAVQSSPSQLMATVFIQVPWSKSLNSLTSHFYHIHLFH